MFRDLTARLKSLLKKPSPPQPTAATVPGLILIGTAYDPFTEHAVEWMTGVLVKINLTCPIVIPLHDKTLSKGDVRAAMASVDVPGRVEIFCGHGDYDALLGPPDTKPDTIVDGIEHSVIYDTTMVPRKPGSLVAFSCRAASILGRTYGAYIGKGFIGFDNDLPLDFSPEFMGQLEDIFHSIIVDVLVEGRIIPRHKAVLENLYDQAVFFFLDGEGHKVPNNFLFQLLLIEHRECIKLYSTHSL